MNDSFILSRGARVREERTRLHMTQEECAEQCGVSRVQWGKYERGATKLDGNVLNAFAALGADAAYILSNHRAQPVSIQQAYTGNMLNQLNQADTLVNVFQNISPTLREAVRDLILAVNIASEPLLMSAIAALAQVVDLPSHANSKQPKIKKKNKHKEPDQHTATGQTQLVNKVGVVHGDYVNQDKIVLNQGS
ncbi:MAG: hypothetical protein NVS3B3_01680 [Aquirhabdus sp.]